MTIALLCHGGAGEISADRHPPCRQGVRDAGLAGYALLQQGTSALDTVEHVVRLLEDNPQYNAGLGSALNADGQVVTDASIMSGHDRRAGAVGAVSGIANPVSLARAVMDDGRHVLLVGQGAEAFARERGFAFCDPASLIVAHERERWEERHGTVGCVALDTRGHLAAATSTGGVVGKRAGRLGDTPLIGAGNWADEQVAVSCTGQGEAMIRTALAHYTACRHDDFDRLEDLARAAIQHMADHTQGQGGLIAVDHDGQIGFSQNTRQMPVYGIGVNGEIDAL
ncbi:isoaspartyl peptidase/L-asparaginase family protein [Natronospira bacteriovora]|uniref:Isoaspartyl peptidase/L-asparaginase family protein n=1 Tax=Natronospira bacteriovora TaxID=3069753 RepID=A0ABU0W7E1_9GAMM|nr:isoaspartyl peptidase/L-asparaginase family protein [Natronospira sp. AB-CW4]MDQ2069941.1 isoaspartyl peptidase/L-asparaginase family protein [Natronospira sp. AB-CW4]